MPVVAGLGITAAFCLICAIVVGYLAFARPVQAGLDAAVVIQTPSEGDVLALNVPATIQAVAAHPTAIKRVELYADGALVAAQDVNPAQNPMVFLQKWTPLTPGQHILIARAYPFEGGFITSPAISVTVRSYSGASQSVVRVGEDGPSVNDIAESTGASVEDILEANPDLPPDPDAPIPPDTDVVVPLPDPAPPPVEEPPAPIPGAPAPPTGLTASADCTPTVTLNWTDAADETEYVIYRLDAPLMTEVATLPANTTNYVGPLPALGSYQYQVASLKDGYESLTPFVLVETPPECIPPLPPAVAVEDVLMSLIEMRTTDTWDATYCYFDVNGTGYQRVPAMDFAYMTPEFDGVTYDLPPQLPDGGVYHVSADTSAGLTLGGECWGKLGPEVSLLGTFSENYGQDTWDGSTRTIDAGSFAIDIILGEPPIVGPFFPFPGWLDLILGILELPAPTNLNIAQSLDGCAEYTGTDFAGCVIWGLFTGGYPTMTWDWTPNAFHQEAELTRYFVRMTAHDLGTGTDTLLWWKNVYRAGPGEEIRRAQILPSLDLPCGSQIIVEIRAFKGTQASQFSSIVWQETDPCNDMEITVTYDSLVLEDQPGFASMYDVAGGDFCFLCVDTTLELDGVLGANWNGLFTATTGGTFFNPCPTDSWCFGPGIHVLSDANTDPATPTSATLVFHQPADQGVTVWLSLNEMDGGVSGTDAYCQAFMSFPATNPANWPATINGTHVLTAPMGVGDEGQCVLEFTIEGHELP
jgi:hypothetical protein